MRKVMMRHQERQRQWEIMAMPPSECQITSTRITQSILQISVAAYPLKPLLCDEDR